MPAVDVQSVLREGAGGNFQHHRGALAGSVVVLLNAINDALAGRVIHDPFPAHGVRDGAALSGMLALGLDSDRVLAEDVELALGERLLVQLAALGRWCDGVEDAGIGNAGFGVVRNQLVPVSGHTDSRIERPVFHEISSLRPGKHL